MRICGNGEWGEMMHGVRGLICIFMCLHCWHCRWNGVEVAKVVLRGDGWGIRRGFIL